MLPTMPAALLPGVAIVLISLCVTGAKAAELDLNATLGDPTARQEACSDYQLSAEDSDISFLGPYQSIVVGTVNYTYHRFGPLDPEDTEYNSSLVLIPGSGSSSKIWQADFLRGLAQNREVITFDPRGYGSADTAPLSELTIDGIASSLVDFFGALELEQPDVLGWNWGGTIALWLGVFYSDSVANLLTFGATAGGDILRRGVAYQTIVDTGLQGKSLPPAYLFPDTEQGNEELCRFLAFFKLMPGPTFTPDQISSQRRLISSVFEDTVLSTAMKENFTHPIYIAHGDQDIALTTDNSWFIYYYGGTLVTLVIEDYAGEAVLYHDVDDVVDDIAFFLRYFDYLIDEYD